MVNKCILKKYAATLALSVMAVLFLSESLFAQGTVVAYAHPVGPRSGHSLDNFPSGDQFSSLTHVIVTAIGVNTDGSLKFMSNDLPGTWSGNTNTWLQGLVSRAHQKGVKVSISISGEREFEEATKPPKLSTFVSQIVTFVNNHGLDGIDIDWEKLRVDTPWDQCVALLKALKNHPSLQGKRISIALPVAHPGYTGFYPAQTSPTLPIPQQI